MTVESSNFKNESTLSAKDFALIACLVVATIFILGKDISVGGLRDGDSSAHVMDGVLILDWVSAGPSAWLRPMDFALEQYARYPTLAIGRHYPPGFAVVEAIFFAVFGISAFTARLCVVFFGCIASVGAYVFVREFADRRVAWLASMLLVTMPLFVHWGRQEMLEVPTLAVMILSAIAVAKYLRCPTRRRWSWMVASLTVSLLFRQTALCLFAAAAIACLVQALRRAVPRSHACGMCLITAVTCVFIVLSLDGHGQKLLRGDETLAFMGAFTKLTFYARQFPSQLGYLALPFALLGLWICTRGARAESWLLVFWLVVGYIMLTIPDYMNPRFAFVLLFPFAVWAAMGAHRVLAFVGRNGAPSIAAGVVAAGALIAAMNRPVEQRPDYGPVVLAHRERIENRIVLFSGLREGDFVFAVRQHLPRGAAAVVRASKLLYTCSGRPDLDYASDIDSLDRLLETMNRFAFSTVFIERSNKVGVIQEDWLREYLSAGKDYKHFAAYPLPADEEPSFRDTVIDVYEGLPHLSKTVDQIDIPIPRINRVARILLAGTPPAP